MTLPLPVRIPKAVVGPLLPGSSLLRSVFQADLNGFDLVQYRSEANAPANTFTVKPLPFKWDKRRRVEGVSLYGGPLLHHFGHMVAEGMHRLWAATAFEHLRDARVVFQVKEGADEPPPAWFAGMLELCGIAPERVLLVDSLTQFDELHIPAQGKALHGEILFDGYLDLFPLVPLDDDGPPPQTRPNLYVSRRRHLHTGSVVGETYVETALRAAGFEIVYPENVATPDFVRRLHGAGTIVFAEGSAIHNLEFLGRFQARVFIIPRRSGTDGRFGPLLEGRSPEWRIYSGLTGRVCMGTSRSVTAAFVDLPQLMDALRDFTGLALPAPDGHETDVALALDLFRYLADQRFKVAEPTDAQLVALLKTFRSQSPVRKLLHRLNKSDATKAR